MVKPIGFVDDDPDRTGKLLSGLPVLGRSYDLDSLIEARGVKAIVMAAPAVSLESQARVASACDRSGIGLFRMNVHLERVVAESATASGLRWGSMVPPTRTADVAAIYTAASLSIPALESEPCARCGSRNVHRSKVKGLYERFRKWHTPTRPFRCTDCGWRGWLLPLERTVPMDEILETDLRSLDTAFPPLTALGGGTSGSDGR